MLLVTDDGQPLVTHSAIKTFRRCPKQFEYKFVRGLRPRVVTKPLKRGDWIHKLLMTHYRGEDWKQEHRRLSQQFNELFDEEKDHYGDLPTECARIMQSYLWHYAHETWKVHNVEFIVETVFPDGMVYRGKVDLLIEDEYGLWLVDHKTHRTLPDHDFRLLDAQSALYLWATDEPIEGFIWNYIRTKSPSTPQVLKSGALSRRRIETDYPTYARALKKQEVTPNIEQRRELKRLKTQQWQPNAMQTSPFFRRDVFEKSDDMIERVAKEAYRTARRIHEYWPCDEDEVERVVDRSCTYMCPYTDICSLELFGAPNVQNVIKQRYVREDPLAYQQDEREDEEYG